jgi:hypothetical protein
MNTESCSKITSSQWRKNQEGPGYYCYIHKGLACKCLSEIVLNCPRSTQL